MKQNANCFPIKCDISRTMRKMCKVLSITDNGYIVAPHDDLGYKIAVRENHARAPKSGEVKALTRLYD